MPAWLLKILTALGPSLFNFIRDLIKDGFDSYKESREQKKLEEKQKQRDSLTRQMELARQKGDKNEIRRIAIALQLLDD